MDARDELAELRESEARYRALAEATVEAVVIHDDGIILDVNEAFVELTGYSRAEAIGMSVGVLVDVSSHAAMLADRASRRDDRREYRVRRKDGAVVIAEIAVRSCAYAGRPARVVVARDVTAQRRSEAERREMQQKLAVADRLSAVGALAAGVAHEINNPLSYVITNVRLVEQRLRRLADDPSAIDPTALRDALRAASSALDEARDGAERVHRIVADLKMFSRGDVHDRRGPVDVARVVEAALHLAEPELRRRARVTSVIEPVPPVLASEAQLGQVVLTLLVNAGESIPVGAADQNEIRVVARTIDGGRVAVEVCDTGPGIAPDARGRAFDPFFSARAPGERAGLGLSMCHALVTGLGGELLVDDGGKPPVDGETGRGACFCVVLPPAPPTSPSVPPPAAPARAERRVARVLVVDDEPMVGRMVERALGQVHRVESVTAGQKAIDLLSAGQRYDVILCDLMMPGMSGMDVYERVLALDHEQAERMVFLSGGAFTRRARDFLEGHPSLEKPFDLGALEDVIQARLR